MPTRRWFQFRLSTAILLMFVFGLFLWLNSPHIGRCVVPDTSPNRHFSQKEVFWPVLGWPLPVGYITPEGEYMHEQSYMFPTAGKILLVMFYLIDLGIVVAALALTAWISERLQRGKSSPQKDPPASPETDAPREP